MISRQFEKGELVKERPRFMASVTLESDTQAPRTHRAEISASSPQKAASLAVRAARKEFSGARWSSLVVVLQKVEAL